MRIVHRLVRAAPACARDWAGGHDLDSVSPAQAAAADCVAILTDHQAFDYEALPVLVPIIVDTRNAVKGHHPHVFRLGAPRPDGEAVLSSPTSSKSLVSSTR